MMTENIDGGQKMLSLGKPTFIKKYFVLADALLTKVLYFLFVNLQNITKLLIPSLQVTEVLMQVMQSS